MSHNFKILVAAILLAGTMPARAASRFLYTVSNYPPSVAGCAAEAASLGRRVHALTGVEIFQTSCDSEFQNSYFISVIYVADAPLNVVTVFDPSAYSQSAYPSLAACQSDSARQTHIFTTETTLEPTVVFCSPSLRDGHATELTIEAFGAAQASPRFFSQPLQGFPPGNMGALATTIAGNAEREGVALFKTVIATGQTESRLSIGYYAPATLPFNIEQSLTFPSWPACAQFLPKMEEIYRTGGEAVLGSFCGSAVSSSLVRLFTVALARDGHVHRDALGAGFASYEACTSGLPALIGGYQAAHTAATVIAGVCSSGLVVDSYEASIYIRESVDTE